MELALEVARSFGLGGLGLMATMLAVKLAIQAVDLVRSQQWRRNGGNGSKVAFDELKVVCPLAPGRHSLDDVHEVLLQIRTGMERLNETQKVIETDMKDRSQRLCDILSALRLELARREG
ncbi:MAG: hypothetical protein Q7V01_09150 [Vicinamibacterales bacterium]|nr:hypothetical protein [Vicinamibacterales bacterium]